MTHRNTTAFVAALSLLCVAQVSHSQLLGTAVTYGVLAGSTVTNTGPTVVNGNVGVWPGNAVTGFPPGIVNGDIHLGDAHAMQAQADLTTAYDHLEGLAFDSDLTGQDLGGLTLLPGVYNFDVAAALTGTLTLDAQNDPDALFVFQIGSTLIIASNATVNMINGADPCNTYWQVGSSATLGTGTTFNGHILALTSITMNTGSNITMGSALARNGAVTLDTNTITACPVPEPMTMVVLAGGLAGVALRRRRSRGA